MPNWHDNHGSLSLPDKDSEGSGEIFETLARDGSHEGWFGHFLKAQPEMHQGRNHTQAQKEFLALSGSPMTRCTSAPSWWHHLKNERRQHT